MLIRVISVNLAKGIAHAAFNPKPAYILCYDNITREQAKSAKNLGLRLILLDTTKYNYKIDDAQYSMYDTVFECSSPIKEARCKYPDII